MRIVYIFLLHKQDDILMFTRFVPWFGLKLSFSVIALCSFDLFCVILPYCFTSNVYNHIKFKSVEKY